MKLLIAIPTTDFVHVEFMKSLVALVEKLSADGINHDVCIESGTLVYLARDKLARKACNEGYTHILWLDSDMVFTDDIVDSLLFCGEAFVSGIAVSRRKPFGSCLFSSLEPVERLTENGSEPFSVAACGFACVLTRVEVFKAVFRANGTAFTPSQKFGEDVACCARARECGFKIMVEPSVRLGHIAHIPVYPDDAPKR